MYSKYLKTIFDFIVALLLTIVSLPVYLLIVPVLFISNRGNPFFLQERPGKDETIFNIIKFKTMKDLTDGDGNLLADHYRLTVIGKVIRKLSLDEIPQLINVLKGDMSLIGPRPLLPEYLTLYSAEQRKRHIVKPGITGWAQVNGRNAISWKEKFELDVWYVDNVSFSLDLKISFKTFKKVVIREGINSSNSATVEKFNGTN